MPRRTGASDFRSFHNNAVVKPSRRARKKRGRKLESDKSKNDLPR